MSEPTRPRAAAPPDSPRAPRVDSLARRVRRLDPRHLPPVARVLAIGCWIASGVLGCILLLPFVATDALPPGRPVAGVPPWLGAIVLLAAAVLAATAVALLLYSELRRPPTRGLIVVRDLVIAGLAVPPSLALIAEGSAWGFLALASVIPAIVVAHAIPDAAGPARVAWVAGLATVPWLVAAVLQAFDPRVADGWLWISAFPFATAFAAWGAFYGVARAIESRQRVIRPIFRDDLSAGVLTIVLVLVVTLFALRFTVASGLFGGMDAMTWRLRPNLSWLHALVVAAVIVAFALDARRRPYRPFGRRGVLVSLGVAGALDFIVLGLIGVVSTAAVVATGEAIDTSGYTPVFALGGLIGVLVILVVTLLPRFRHSLGRVIAIIAAVYLVPAMLAVLLAEQVTFGFAASAAQVGAVLTLAGGGLLAWNHLRVGPAIPAGLVLRLLVIPLLAVHAALLIPFWWANEIGRIVLVLGVLGSLLLFAPRVAADPVRQARNILRLSAAQLLALVVFLLAIPLAADNALIEALGQLWFAVPVTAALLLREEPTEP